MDARHDAPGDFDCPSLLCEEQENFETKNEEDGADVPNQINETYKAHVNEHNNKEEKNPDVQESVAECESRSPHEEQNQTDAEDQLASKKLNDRTEQLEDNEEQKRGRKRRGKKQNDRTKGKKPCKGVNNNKVETEKNTQEVSTTSPSRSVDCSASAEKPIYLGCGTSRLYCNSAPMPLLYSSNAPVAIQPKHPKHTGTKRPPTLQLQSSTQPLKMEMTQVCSVRRSIRHGTKGRGQSLGFQVMLESENIEEDLLPPAPKKKTRTLYNIDQLQSLEAQFQEEHYPDAEKRKVIAASVGVTPQRIMVWFQNRRAKWRKVERLFNAKIEPQLSGPGPHISPSHGPNNTILPGLLLENKTPSFSSDFTSKLSQIPPSVPNFPTPLYNSLLTSPGQSRARDVDPHQLSSQGGSAEYHPRPMHSPPPIRRASLPLFTAAYSSANINPPLLNSLAHTPPMFLDALEVGASLAHHDTQPLAADTSSLFDFGEKLDYLTPVQQNNLFYQLQTTYASTQPQHQPQVSLPRMSFLTPSPYLTPNPPESNPPSYLTFRPGGGSSGVVTYSTAGHAFFQTQSTGQVLLQSTGHHSGMAAYQSYPWGSIYSQPSVHQRPLCPSAYPSSLGAPRDHQLPPSGSVPPPPVFFSRGDHSLSNPSCLSHPSSSSSTTVLPPVSTLRRPRLRAETTPTKAASLLDTQVSPASPERPPVPSCAKIEYDSPHQVHSHFHCDFSPIHF